MLYCCKVAFYNFLFVYFQKLPELFHIKLEVIKIIYLNLASTLYFNFFF